MTSVVITGGESALDISAFNEFVELAKRLNITETARMLNMSQPTLSKHIISFEKELRLSLFERTGSAMRLTEAGNALLPFAYKILDAQSMFYEEARRIKSEAPARLSVTGLTDETVVMALLLSLIHIYTRCVLRSQLMDAGRNASANATAVGVRNGSDTTTKSRVRTCLLYTSASTYSMQRRTNPSAS